MSLNLSFSTANCTTRPSVVVTNVFNNENPVCVLIIPPVHRALELEKFVPRELIVAAKKWM